MKDFDQEFALVKKKRVNVSFKKSIDSMSMFVDKSPGKLSTASILEISLFEQIQR